MLPRRLAEGAIDLPQYVQNFTIVTTRGKLDLETTYLLSAERIPDGQTGILNNNGD